VQAVQSTSRGRVASEERWQAALRRALANGVEIFTVAGSAQLMATSVSRLDVLYPVSATDCGCPAARDRDPVCQHRAAARFILGLLDDPREPQPRPCLWCSGRGVVPNDYQQRYDRCVDCAGTGLWQAVAA
jgi:hypothetical protein